VTELAPPRIVVIDDDAAMRRVLDRILRQRHYDPISFAAHEPAVEWLSRNTASLVISDVNIGRGGEGIVFAREAALRWPTLPVLLITGASTEVEGHCLRKPFEPGEFLAEVERFLNDAAARKQS